jgi:hypothetical protein
MAASSSHSLTADSILTTPPPASIGITSGTYQTLEDHTTKQSMTTNEPGVTIRSTQASRTVSGDLSNLSTADSGSASATPQASPAGGLSKDTLAKLKSVAKKGRTLDQFEKDGKPYYGVREAEISAPISHFINKARKKPLLFRLEVRKVLMTATKKEPPDGVSGWDTFLKNRKLQASRHKSFFGYLDWHTMWLILETQGYCGQEGIQSFNSEVTLAPSLLGRGGPQSRPKFQAILMEWDGNDSTWNNLWVRFQKFRELCESDAHREEARIGRTSQTSNGKRGGTPSSGSGDDSDASKEGSRGKTDNNNDVPSDVSLVHRPDSFQQSTVAVSSAGVSSFQQRKSERRKIWTPTKRLCNRGKTILKYLPLSAGIDRSHIPACKRFFCDKLVPYMNLHRCTQKTNLNAILGFLARARRGQVKALTKMTKKLFDELRKQGEFIRLWGLEDRLPSPHDSVGRRLERDACLILGIKPEPCVGTDN